jgi:AhpD family alkylhydroperoxidase
MNMSYRLSFNMVALGLVLGSAAWARAESTEATATLTEIQKTFGFVPGFLKGMPDTVLPGFWQELSGLQMNPNTALPGKAKELIAVGVASQIPCEYCVYAHTQFAKVNRASEAEIGEAIGVAALIRHWSAFINGLAPDEQKFKAELAQLVANIKKMSAGGIAPSKPMMVTDARSALEDVRQTFGMVPDFLKRFPPEALPGAWNMMKSVQLSPQTKLSSKHKNLIGLAVAAQIPCKFCITAHTEFAKLDGANEREITEALAMASLTRAGSTILNGQQADKAAFRRDIDKLVATARKHAAMAAREKTASRMDR